MRLCDVLAKPQLGLRLLVGREQLERPVRQVCTTDLLDPRRYLSGGEIVLTGLMWRRGPADSDAFVAALAESGVTALGAGEAAFGQVPADLVDACRRHGVALFSVPVDVSFGVVAAAVTPVRRSLVAAMAAGARLAELVPLVAADLGVPCWVLSPTGVVVAGSEPLDEEIGVRLGYLFLTADRVPRLVSVPGRGRYTIFAGHNRHSYRLADWFLASTGDLSGPGPLRGPLDELVNVVSLEQARRDESAQVERRLAGQLSQVLLGGGAPAEVAARLTACGLPADGDLVAVVAGLPGAPSQVLATVLHELVGSTRGASAAGSSGGGASGTGGGTGGGMGGGMGGMDGGAGSVAAVAGPDDGAPAGTALAIVPAAPDTLSRIRTRAGQLAPGLGSGLGLGPAARLTVGVSDCARGAGALAAAVEEARHAETLASGGVTARTGRVTVMSSADLCSHLLLLAGVPATARRSFEQRLLGPVIEYDREHNADLIRTLDTFLGCDGSWSRSAAALHVHVNTLRYRIRRIEQLTGRDLGRFEDRVDFFLALRMRR